MVRVLLLLALLVTGCSIREREADAPKERFPQSGTNYELDTLRSVGSVDSLLITVSRQRDDALALAKKAVDQRDANTYRSERLARLLVDHFAKDSMKFRMPDGSTLALYPTGKDSLVEISPRRISDSLRIVIEPLLSWRSEVAKNKPKPGELRRADYAYDAGGMYDRGEIDGRFRIADIQVVYQTIGSVVIPDTLLIVAPFKADSPEWRERIVPGRYTVVDTVFEVYTTSEPSRIDTTLIVRPH